LKAITNALSQPKRLKSNNREAHKKPVSTDQNTFEAIVGIAKDDVAVAPGTLLQTWPEGDRHVVNKVLNVNRFSLMFYPRNKRYF
jgi:hypothetical protein